jgi:hypothetical protein
VDWREQSERRQKVKKRLKEADLIDASDIIVTPAKAKERELTSTISNPSINSSFF